MGIGRDTLLQLLRGSLEGPTGMQMMFQKREEEPDEAQDHRDVEMQSPTIDGDGTASQTNETVQQVCISHVSM